MSFQRSMKSQRSLGQPQRSGLDYRNSFLSADGERRKGMVLPFDPLVRSAPGRTLQCLCNQRSAGVSSASFMNGLP